MSQEIKNFLENNKLIWGKTDCLAIMRLLKKFYEVERLKSPSKNQTAILAEFGKFFERSHAWAHQFFCVANLPEEVINQIVKDGRLIVSVSDAYLLSIKPTKKRQDSLDYLLRKKEKVLLKKAARDISKTNIIKRVEPELMPTIVNIVSAVFPPSTPPKNTASPE